ncbi:DUF4326 domain-containing protein [Mycobacterium sp. NAZ190054]|uniref:DUF4326 domain-containing protein n=1 Tax=Mycobacterium sp. NAZ190054 TaxID=1747766 RepID=UPI000798EDBE|nr:DUF4326 domain-containing protein [Mycobacterium sp. NAZ190054]KWX66856.1 hypothetical protein ASJ79_05480 [Mycobacterium sp. NAZ190054]
MPQRIQRKRTKGWRMPEGAIYVGRPTIFGNPFVIGAIADRRYFGIVQQIEVAGPAHAVELYRDWLTNPHSSFITGFARMHPTLIIDKLRGRDLACWCPLSSPCHADVLLEVANS